MVTTSSAHRELIRRECRVHEAPPLHCERCADGALAFLLDNHRCGRCVSRRIHLLQTYGSVMGMICDALFAVQCRLAQLQMFIVDDTTKDVNVDDR